MYIPLILFVLMLLFPELTKSGAYDGLILWFNIIIPTLLPFMIINGLICHFNAFEIVSRLLYPLTKRVFKISKNANYCLIMGFLCGFPMGSKTIADMIDSRKISLSEGAYLLSFCNNLSPAFILNYVVSSILLNCYKIPMNKIYLFYFIIFFSPVIVSFLYRYIEKYDYKLSISTNTNKNKSISSFKANFLDNCILNSFENIFKIGGYIIIFTIISTWILNLPIINGNIGFLSSSIFEVTSGLFTLKHTCLSYKSAMILLLSLCSFGGICSIAQTYSMIAETPLKLSSYIKYKVINSIVSFILGIILI